MKICIDCEFYTRKTIATGQQPPNHFAVAAVCEHSECRDPVNGDSLLCQVSRMKEEFCGLLGKRFKLKEVKPTESANKASVIEILK